jgi:hypothetical protein
MVHSAGLLLLHGGLFLAPCGVVLTRCALSPSVFSLHPAANALALFVCFPAYDLRPMDQCGRRLLTLLNIVHSGIFAMIKRKETSDHTRR